MSRMASTIAEARRRVVVLGTGWGGFALAGSLDKTIFDVSVVSPRNHMLFTPLLASTAVGTLEHRSIISPVRELGFRNRSDFHLSHAVDVDPEEKRVTCVPAVGPGEPYELAYDDLVLAIGSQPNTFGLEGVDKHALFLKELSDARAIRQRVLDNLEEATGALAGRASAMRKDALLNVVVVGGGPTGVEFAGEMYDLLRSDMTKLFPEVAENMRITLVAGSGVLSAFHHSLQTYAVDALSSRPQVELLYQNVQTVSESGVTLDCGREIPSACVVWAAGVGPRPLTTRLEESRGFPLHWQRFKVDPHLRVPGMDSVYALGDCAAIEDNMHPQTAQVAETQAYYLADVLRDAACGVCPSDRAEPYVFRPKGALAYLGGFRAISDFSMAKLTKDVDENDDPASRSSFFTLAGFHSWVLWRSAYMTKLGSWRARFQVPLDWFKTFVFGRDLSRFSSSTRFSSSSPSTPTTDHSS